MKTSPVLKELFAYSRSMMDKTAWKYLRQLERASSS